MYATPTQSLIQWINKMGQAQKSLDSTSPIMQHSTVFLCSQMFYIFFITSFMFFAWLQDKFPLGHEKKVKAEVEYLKPPFFFAISYLMCSSKQI